MIDKEMHKLRRPELLEMLIHLSEENDRLNQEQAKLQQLLDDRKLSFQNAGSIAEAALQVSGIFEDAQKAAAQYLENVQRLSDSAQAEAAARLEQAREKCAALEAAAQQQSEAKLADTQRKCSEMTAEAKKNADLQWATLKSRLDEYCQAHDGLKEKLSQMNQ